MSHTIVANCSFLLCPAIPPRPTPTSNKTSAEHLKGKASTVPVKEAVLLVVTFSFLSAIHLSLSRSNPVKFLTSMPSITLPAHPNGQLKASLDPPQVNKQPFLWPSALCSQDSQKKYNCTFHHEAEVARYSSASVTPHYMLAINHCLWYRSPPQFTKLPAQIST